jgi:type IV secretory pathway VirB10-like protein
VISIAGAAAQLSQPQQSAFQGYSPSSVAAASMTQGYAQLGQEYARAGLSIPNTLEIRPGYRFTIMVHNDWRLPVYVDSLFYRPRLGGVRIN